MTNNHTKQKAGKLCGILVFALLLVLIPSFFFDFYYDLNDDTAIKDIISGAYTGTPSGYSIQMLYPLSWLIALFYRAIPALPWYGLFLCLCQFGVFVLMGWRLLNLMKGFAAKVISMAVLFFVVLGLFIRQLVFVQYSVTSAICMVGAVFLFATCDVTGRVSEFLRKNAVAAVLVVISFMIRTEMCLMLMPFLLLVGIVKMRREGGFKKCIVLMGTALVGMLAVYSVDKVAYIGSEWSSFLTFFNARTNLYDFYGLPAYDDGNEEFYNSIGLSKESYTLLENYNFALDESIDSWLLKSISDYQRENAGTANGLSDTLGFVSKNNIREALWLYERHILSGITKSSQYVVAEYGVAAAYLICILLAVFRKLGDRECVNLFEIMALMFVRSVLWLYLYMVGRVLDRVTVPLLMLELCVLVLFIMGSLKGDTIKPARTFVCITLIALPVIAMGFSFGDVSSEYRLRAAADERWNALMDYCEGEADSYYVIDVYSSTSYNGAAYSEKIFKNVDNSYKNYDICGGWVAKSPLARQKLAKSGIKDIQSALYNHKAYFVAACGKDVTWLGEYYRNRGYDVSPICVDTIYTNEGEAAFTVYELDK